MKCSTKIKALQNFGVMACFISRGMHRRRVSMASNHAIPHCLILRCTDVSRSTYTMKACVHVHV